MASIVRNKHLAMKKSAAKLQNLLDEKSSRRKFEIGLEHATPEERHKAREMLAKSEKVVSKKTPFVWTNTRFYYKSSKEYYENTSRMKYALGNAL